MSEPVFTRRALLALFVTALAGVQAIHPTWAQAIGADVWNVPALKEQLRETAAHNDRLGAEDEEVMRRIAVKEALIADLLANRATLAEVTGQFIELDTSRPVYMTILRSTHLGATDREVMARTVIGYAIPRADPSERAAVSRRLEADLRQMRSVATP